MFGLGFTVLGAAWFSGLLDERYLSVGWLGPVLLILSGIAVIATLVSPDPATSGPPPTDDATAGDTERLADGFDA